MIRFDRYREARRATYELLVPLEPSAEMEDPPPPPEYMVGIRSDPVNPPRHSA